MGITGKDLADIEVDVEVEERHAVAEKNFHTRKNLEELGSVLLYDSTGETANRLDANS